MNTFRLVRVGLGCLLLPAVCLSVGFAQSAPGANDPTDSWTSVFTVETGELASTGRNPYFVLEPGYQQVLEGGGERLTITVLSETEVIDGVETRVVEERETNQGQLVEVSRNYFVISRRTNSIFYFGEDVDMYVNGKIADHEGSWKSGINGAHFGMMMPGEALLKSRYYQERAPKVAMDRAEIVSLEERVTVPVGLFDHALKVFETTPLEPASREYKYYARGVGLVQEGSATLVRYGKAEPQKN